MRVEKTLVHVGDRLSRAREELRIVEEQLLFQIDVVDQARTRMLLSETPLADREFRMARDDLDRIEAQRSRLQDEISEMRDEQDRLLDRMSGRG